VVNATILLGSSSITEPEEGSVIMNVPKSGLLVHSNYNARNLQYDIALIRLPSPIEMSGNRISLFTFNYLKSSLLI
jgi:hypothetical protein